MNIISDDEQMYIIRWLGGDGVPLTDFRHIKGKTRAQSFCDRLIDTYEIHHWIEEE